MTLAIFDNDAMWFAKNAFTAKGVLTTNMTVGRLALDVFFPSGFTIHHQVTL